jgi:[protein-PII] uridylyltransferase
VRDLKRVRLEVAGQLHAEQVPGAQRRKFLSSLSIEALQTHWAEQTGGLAEGVTLAAVGSLGRGDAGPMSDLDVLVVYDPGTIKRDALTELTQRLWYPMWDAGLELDYSVRTITECRQVADKDLAAAAGLLDLRFVAGDEALAKSARSLIFADWRAAARKRLPELLAARRARAERFGELAYLIEPHLKESRGGLRDLVSLTALSATWLTDRPHGAVDEAGEHLMDVRDALHLVTRKPQNTLGRHLADEVAAACGFDDPDDLLASLAEAGRTVAYAVDTTERGARRALERSGIGSRAWRAKRFGRAPMHVSVGSGLIDVDGELALSAQYDVETDPLLPLRAAATAATKGLTLSPTMLSTLQKCPELPAPWPQEGRELLRQLLRSGDALLSVWEAFDLYGFTERWLPEWGEVRNRPQRSSVHRFTVDRHLIETVMVAAKSKRAVPDADLLLAAAWLHDIGKRPGEQGHSEHGAAMIPGIAARIGWDAHFTADVHTLVLHHLLLAELATTHDPEDPQTVARLLDTIGHRADMLETLRALTEADARAAGPKAWTQWRETLIDTLTSHARLALNAEASPARG